MTTTASLLIIVAATTLPISAVAQPIDYPRYGTTSGEPKKGDVTASKYPGNGYGITAIGTRDRLSEAERRILSQKVLVRAAQLALENDRPTFSLLMSGRTSSGGELRREAGKAGYTYTGGRMVDGQLVDRQQVTVPGTPGRTYRTASYSGESGMVMLWAKGQKPTSDASSPSWKLYDAERVYRDLAGQTPGRWPSLVSIYSGLASRATRAGNAMTAAERETGIRTYLKLATLYAQSDDEAKAQDALKRSTALVRR